MQKIKVSRKRLQSKRSKLTVGAEAEAEAAASRADLTAPRKARQATLLTSRSRRYLMMSCYRVSPSLSVGQKQSNLPKTSKVSLTLPM